MATAEKPDSPKEVRILLISALIAAGCSERPAGRGSHHGDGGGIGLDSGRHRDAAPRYPDGGPPDPDGGDLEPDGGAFLDATPGDTGLFDADRSDADLPDAGPADTGPADTGPADTGPADTGPADTGPADTGPADTGPADSGVPPDVHIHIYVDNFCNMMVVPASYTVANGQTVYFDWHNHSADYAVDVWMSYGGGYLDLPTGATWDEPIGHCIGPNPHTEYADISTACSSHRFFIECQ